MAAVTGKINIGITATTAGLTRGLDRASSAVGSFASRLTSLPALLAGAGAAIGVGLSVNALKNWTAGAAESIDETAKLSDRLGLATEDLAGFQHAASLAGVSNEKLASGLGKFQVNIAKAAEGTGDAAKVLTELGLAPQELLKAGTSDALKSVADALNAIDNPAEKARAAVAIFGKAGLELLPFLSEGRAGLDAMAAEAERLGISFSRVDAAQVEAANDAITRAKSVFTGFVNQVAIGLAPLIEAAATAFTAFATSGTTAGDIVTDAIEMAVMAVVGLVDAIANIPAAWRLAQAGAVAAVATIAEGVASLVNLTVNVGSFVPGFRGTIGEDVLRGIQGPANEIANSLRQSADTALGESLAAFGQSDFGNRAQAFFDGIRASSREAAQAIADDAAKGAAGAGLAFEALYEDQQRIADFAEQIRKDIATPQEQLDEFRRQIDEAVAAGELFQTEADLAIAKKQKDLFGRGADKQQVAALEQGSAAALSQFLANQRKDRDPVAENTAKTAAATQQTARLLQQAPVLRFAAV